MIDDADRSSTHSSENDELHRTGQDDPSHESDNQAGPAEDSPQSGMSGPDPQLYSNSKNYFSQPPPPPGPGYRKHLDKIRRRKPKPWSVEKQFTVNIIQLVLTIALVLLYLPGYPLIELEWLIGNQLARLAAIPVILILLAMNLSALRWKSVAWSVALLALLVVELVMNVPLSGPRQIEVKPDERIRVLTFNTGVHYPKGLVKHLAQENIDVAFLQELYSFHVDTLFHYTGKAGYRGHFLKLRDDSGTGLVLLYRGELDTLQILRVESFGGKWRRFILADVVFGQHKARVVGVHFESNSRKLGFSGFLKAWDYRRKQAEMVASIADTTFFPMVVVGDMNATVTDRSIRPLRKTLKDSWQEAGFFLGGTWNRQRPVLRIDQVLYKEFPGAANARVIKDFQLSDHLALQVDLLW